MTPEGKQYHPQTTHMEAGFGAATLDHIDKEKSTQIAHPKEIALMLYPDCQLDCKFCYTKGLKIGLGAEELSNFYTNIIRSYDVKGHYPRIFIGGLGEPTLGRNHQMLEKLLDEFPKNKFVVFSNLVEPEKSAALARAHPNLENIVGRIVGENGGDTVLEGKHRPSLAEAIRTYREAGVLDRLKYEILLVPANLDKTFPTALLDEAGVSYSYAAAVPLGEALKNNAYLNRKEVIEQNKLRGSSKASEDSFLGRPDCRLVNNALILSGLSVSLCPAALIKEVYATYPKKYASKLIEDEDGLSELRKVTSELIALKRGKGVAATNMCVGRELLYSKSPTRLITGKRRRA